MTLNEAAERVRRIWVGRFVHYVGKRADGGVDVQLDDVHSLSNPHRVLASDTRDRHLVAHQLDANGHVVCHDDCRRLEV